MTPPTTTEIAKVRREASSLTAPVVTTVQYLTIIDSDSYANADGVLSKIRAAKKGVQEKFEPIITPIYKGLELLYKFRKELIDPLDSAEKDVKLKMSIWQTGERKRIAAENEAKEAEAAKLRKELAEKEARIEAATRKSVKTALTNKTTELSEKLVEVESQPVATATKGQHSGTREITWCLVTDPLAFYKAVVAGEIPLDVVLVDEAKLRKYYSLDPATVISWPGVKVEHKIQIVGR